MVTHLLPVRLQREPDDEKLHMLLIDLRTGYHEEAARLYHPDDDWSAKDL